MTNEALEKYREYKRERAREYRKNNLEKMRAYQREYYRTHKDQHKESQRRWKEKRFGVADATIDQGNGDNNE